MLYSLLFTAAFANPWPDLSEKVSTSLQSGKSNDHALVIAVEDYVFVPDVPGATQNGGVITSSHVKGLWISVDNQF